MGKHFTGYEKGEIARLHKEGLTHREIGEQLGYTRMQIKYCLKRLRKKEQVSEVPDAPKRKGRPRKTPLTQQRAHELRIKELEREVELLRSFLHAAGGRWIRA